MGTGGSFPGRQSDRVVKLTTYLDLVLRSRIVEKYLHSPTLHGVIFNALINGTTLPYLSEKINTMDWSLSGETDSRSASRTVGYCIRKIEPHGINRNAFDLCLGAVGFESGLGYRLLSLRLSVFFLAPARRIQE